MHLFKVNPYTTQCKRFVNTKPTIIYTKARIEDVAKKLGIKDPTDWYKVTSKDLAKIDSSLFKHNSLSKLIPSFYPDYEWHTWKFNERIPNGFWDDLKNQKNFMEWVKKELKYTTMEDWYNVTHKDFCDLGGGTLLKDLYHGSPSLLLATVYPDYEWLPWKFGRVSVNFWADVKNQKKFMEMVEKKLSINKMEDWYNVTNKDVYDCGGKPLVDEYYNGSISALLAGIYPEHEWLPWKFKKTRRHFWGEVANQRIFLDWAGKQLHIKEISDWYRVSERDLKELGCGALLSYYGYSYSKMLAVVYSEYEWLAWKFPRTPDNFWQKPENVTTFIEYAANKLSITSIEDWLKVATQVTILYNVCVPKVTKDIHRLGGPRNKKLVDLLCIVYPERNWEELKKE